MKHLKIVLGADHRGFTLKEYLKKQTHWGDFSVLWHDVGAYHNNRSDYPIFAIEACEFMLMNKTDYGILLCGSGIGMAVVANRFKGIYAGVAWNEKVARSCKEDDNITMLILPADYVSHEEACNMIIIWLHASFKKGRYQERVSIIDQI